MKELEPHSKMCRLEIIVKDGSGQESRPEIIKGRSEDILLLAETLIELQRSGHPSLRDTDLVIDGERWENGEKKTSAV